MRRRLLAVCAASVILVGVSACGNGSSDKGSSSSASASAGQAIPGLTVTGAANSAPKVTFKAPLTVKGTKTQVISTGTGDPVVQDKPAMLNLYVANGTTGKKAYSTYDQGKPSAITMSSSQFIPALTTALVGKPQGTRVALAAPVKSVFGASGQTQLGLKPTDNVVLVADVAVSPPKNVLTAPDGAKATVPAGLPTIVQTGTKVTNLDFSKAAKAPSKKLQIIPITKGTGPATKAGDLVTFNYFGEVYGAKKAFDESYTKTPATFPLGTGGLIKAWDQGLVGVKQGSRVLVIAPASYAYGAAGSPQGGIPKNATLAFVVDILGVSK